MIKLCTISSNKFLEKLEMLSEYVICPECRFETSIPLEGLPTNYGLNRLVEQFSNLEDHVTVVKSHMMPHMESAAKRIAWKVIVIIGQHLLKYTLNKHNIILTVD